MYKITFFPSHRQISWILLTKRYSPTDRFYSPTDSADFHRYFLRLIRLFIRGTYTEFKQTSDMFFLFIAVYIFRLAHRANA